MLVFSLVVDVPLFVVLVSTFVDVLLLPVFVVVLSILLEPLSVTSLLVSIFSFGWYVELSKAEIFDSDEPVVKLLLLVVPSSSTTSLSDIDVVELPFSLTDCVLDNFVVLVFVPVEDVVSVVVVFQHLSWGAECYCKAYAKLPTNSAFFIGK